jgi:DNA-binding SARP family transcriptional activator
MDFRILGPLEVRERDRAIPLGGGKQRALLALLVMHANQTISVERLVDELWPERAPATAPKVVQNHVSHLRRALGDGLLVTRGAGYALELAPGQLDRDRFEELLDQGRRALASSDAERTSRLLREALGLWRGPPLADFAFESFAQAETRPGAGHDGAARAARATLIYAAPKIERNASSSRSRSSGVL